MAITIYHNPRCETSRNVLTLIRAKGEEPRIIEYPRRRLVGASCSSSSTAWERA